MQIVTRPTFFKIVQGLLSAVFDLHWIYFFVWFIYVVWSKIASLPKKKNPQIINH